MNFVPPNFRRSDGSTVGDAPVRRPAPPAPSDVAHPTAVPPSAPHVALPGPQPPEATLGELLVAMRSDVDAVREAAWAACYARYHQVVWSRAFYVMRSVAWLAEPREAAADVASDVFVGLPDAARHYREEGRAEWWLKQITVRTALRRKEALTGRWRSGRVSEAPADAPGPPAARGRSYVSFDETADEIVARLDAVDREELLELERRRAALRASVDAQHRRWAEFLDLYVAGYDFREIGAHMNLSEGTARNWLCRIRKHLAQPPERDASGRRAPVDSTYRAADARSAGSAGVGAPGAG